MTDIADRTGRTSSILVVIDDEDGSAIDVTVSSWGRVRVGPVRGPLPSVEVPLLVGGGGFVEERR